MVGILCQGWNRTSPHSSTTQWLAVPRIRSTSMKDCFLGHYLSSSMGAFVVTIMPVPAQFWQGISLPDGCFTDPLPSRIEQLCFVVINPLLDLNEVCWVLIVRTARSVRRGFL
jgi:hypothetical protein